MKYGIVLNAEDLGLVETALLEYRKLFEEDEDADLRKHLANVLVRIREQTLDPLSDD